MSHFIGLHIDLDSLSIQYRKQGKNMAYRPLCKFITVALKLAEDFRYKVRLYLNSFQSPRKRLETWEGFLSQRAFFSRVYCLRLSQTFSKEQR